MIAARVGVSVLLGALALPSAAAAADRDRDKVFDALEAKLERAGQHAVVVSLTGPADAAAVRAIEADVGALGAVRRLRLVDAFAAAATPEQITALARRPDVTHVEEDAPVVPFGAAAQAAFGITRAREDIPGLDGHGLTAAVIDSGIDTTMPDLAGAKVVGFKDFVGGRETPYDDLGHGSLVSAVLAGSGASGPEGRGVAPAASLVGVKVIDSGAQSSLSRIAEGIQWVVENRDRYGIDAINLSIGEPQGCGDGEDVASLAVAAAVAAGIVVVAAAGNAGPAACTIKAPAAAESALTVGAMAEPSAGGFSQAWFSSRGPTADGRVKPDISAAGVNVVIPRPEGGTLEGSGTSAAAPFVTGTALLLLQANASLTPAAVKDAITRTAIDWGAPGRDHEYGSGRLDAYAALHAVGAELAVPPGVPGHRLWTGTLAAGEEARTEVEVAGAAFPLAVTMNAPGSGFDLQLLDAAGAAVGVMTAQPAASRQEDVALKAPAPGRYTVVVRAREGAGDFVADLSGAFAPADTAPPALTLDGPAAATNDPTPEWRGAAGSEAGDFPGVVVRVRRGPEVVRRIGVTPLLGRWSVTPAALPDGDYTVDAEQGDDGGNVTRVPARAFTVDTRAPEPPGVATADGSISTTGAVAFAGTAEAGATVRVLEGDAVRASVRADADGTWATVLAGVGDGLHAYAVTATDAAGNVSAAVTRTVTVDTRPAASDTPTVDTRPASDTPTVDTRPASDTPTVDTRPAASDTPTDLGPAPRPTAEPAGPVLGLTVARQRLRTVLRRGLTLRLRCSLGCRTTIVVARGARRVMRRTVSATARGTRVTLRLPAATRKALARSRRVTLTLTVSAAGARTVVRRVNLAR